MAIYRGAGGAGDATNDATSQSILAAQSAQEAAASEAAAASSASNASTSATNAASSATAAANSATSAANSASTATTQAANAASSAATATTKASEAADSATAADSSATTAATSATNASNSATAAANSATSASNSASAASTSASNAATYASNAATSATNAAASETNAAASANSASNSATSATASATSAGNSASSATTSATNAANSASAAATSASNAATSATNASNSASSASTSATNAANSATAAATSETNAASSASGAASSASSAAASAAAAAASLDSFDDRYLGSKTADPTLDNDGNALVTGALYYNSVEGEMRVYDGFQWIAASAASQAILVVYKYTATAGQTTFTGTDDNALTLAYTVGSIIVTVNGVVQEVGTDVTASTGTSIVLAVAASAGDEVNIHAFSTFDVANTYTKAEADAKYLTKVNPSASGNLTFTGTGNRITGDFSNATIANRVAFQTSTSNDNTLVTAIPNGTSNFSGFYALNGTSANVSRGSFAVSATDVRLVSGIEGTGTYLPMTFYTGGSERMRIDTSGNVGIGTSSPAAQLHVQNSGGNSESILAQYGSGTRALIGAYSNLVAFKAYNGTNDVMAFYTGASERMRIDSSGNVGIGAYATTGTSAGVRIIPDNGAGVGYIGISHTSADSGGNWFVNFVRNNVSIGNIASSGTTNVLYSTSSDYRLKENIQPMQNALGVVAQLNPVTYTWKADGSDGQGFIAHELQAVVPDCVTGEKDAVDAEGNPVYQGIDTSFLVATLTKAIQEQQQQINVLAAKVAALEAK